MSWKKAKTIRVLLLVVACIACVVGIIKSQKATRDVSRIHVQITDKKSFESDDGSFKISYTFEIENKTNVDWTYLRVTTYVYDKNGNQLGTITSDFGEYWGTGFIIKKREKTTGEVVVSSKQYDVFFEQLYGTNFSDLIYKSEVKEGRYIKN